MPSSFHCFLLALLLVHLPVKSFSSEENPLVLKTVVLDAGHGGKDPGAVHGSILEKDINLDIVLKLGQLIKSNHPDVNVIYTRSTDIFIPLVTRTDIANRNHADLFISVHVNSVEGSSQASGTETFIMGTQSSASNMEVCRRENSVILLEDDYTTAYQGYNPNDPSSYIIFNLMQNVNFEQSLEFASIVQQNLCKGPVKKDRGIKQGQLVVIWRTTMPSVLVETGFLSTGSDRAILTDSDKRREIASRLSDAFTTFKRKYESGQSTAGRGKDDVSGHEPVVASSGEISGDSRDKTVKKPGAGSKEPVVSSKEPDVSSKTDISPKEPQTRDVTYRVQILASKKKIPAGSSELKGIKSYDCVYDSGFYKYLTGSYKSSREASSAALAQRKKFRGAFVVKVDKDGSILK